MRKLTSTDYRLLVELIKNSRRSDRELARVLHVSQPTITRRRAFLEKEFIESYTAILRWEKLGYEILAITLVKIKTDIASREHYGSTRRKGLQWLASQPNIIMSGGCRRAGTDSFMVSLHKNYPDYDDFMRDYGLELGEFASDIQSILVNLAGKGILKPLSFKYLLDAE